MWYVVVHKPAVMIREQPDEKAGTTKYTRLLEREYRYSQAKMVGRKKAGKTGARHDACMSVRSLRRCSYPNYAGWQKAEGSACEGQPARVRFVRFLNGFRFVAPY